jgi:hypothetical protein
VVGDGRGIAQRPPAAEFARLAGIRAFVWTGAEDARRYIAEFDREFPATTEF